MGRIAEIRGGAASSCRELGQGINSSREWKGEGEVPTRTATERYKIIGKQCVSTHRHGVSYTRYVEDNLKRCHECRHHVALFRAAPLAQAKIRSFSRSSVTPASGTPHFAYSISLVQTLSTSSSAELTRYSYRILCVYAYTGCAWPVLYTVLVRRVVSFTY
jgi:hypothetical protein